LRSALELALANAWALAALAFARDSATFLLHRLSQRATNAAAAWAIGGDVVSAAAPNAWWLCLDPAFLEAFPGYQALVAAFFALALPVNVAVNAAAAAAAVVLCTSRRGADGALMLPRRPVAGAASAGQPGERKKKDSKKRRAPPPQGPLAVAPGPWWAVEPWTAEAGGRQGGVGRMGAASCSCSSPSDGNGGGLGRSGSASFATLPPRRIRRSSGDDGGEQQDPPPASLPSIRLPLARLPLGPVRGPWHGAAAAVAAARAALATPGLLWRAWCADLWVSAQSVPLQALALAVLPAPWAVPRLLAIQLAVPAAVLEAREREPAAAPSSSTPASSLPDRVRAAARSAVASVARSCDLMRGARASYAWPFVAAYALGRAVDAARDAAVAAVPQRWWADVPELPLAAVALFVALRFLAARALELLPLAFYLEQRRREGLLLLVSGAGGDRDDDEAAASAKPAAS
jgi:hypothetical protein